MKDPMEWILEIEDEIAVELYEEDGIKINGAYKKYCGEFALEDIFTPTSVYICAGKCAKRFMFKCDTYEFMRAPMLNSYKLCMSVLSGTFKPTYRRARKIFERGKIRTIKPPTFECKVVQKVLCDYLIRELFEPKMISTSYASIRGRGTDKMYSDVLEAINNVLASDKFTDEAVIVITDFRSYFPSIDNNILRSVYERYVSDKRIIDLIMSFCNPEGGLALGNETSQVPASYFPSPIDHYFKDRLGVKHYFRYCDDTLYIARNMQEAEDLIAFHKKMAADLHLNLPDEKIKTYPIRTSFRFCKEEFRYNRKRKSYYRMMNPQIAKNERKKLKAFKERLDDPEEDISKEEVLKQYLTVRGMIRSRENTQNILNDLDAEVESMGIEIPTKAKRKDKVKYKENAISEAAPEETHEDDRRKEPMYLSNEDLIGLWLDWFDERSHPAKAQQK